LTSLVTRLRRLSPRRLLAAAAELEDLRAQVHRLDTRVRQLVAAHETTEKVAGRVRGALAAFDPARVQAHVTEAVTAAPLGPRPFPHLVVEDWLPEATYRQIVNAVPPVLFFEHLDGAHQEVMIPSDLAPRLSREVWEAFYRVAVVEALVPGLVDRFREPLDRLVHEHWPAYASLAEAGIELDILMSRILLRRPGYAIKPHRDPRWAFLTCLIYLPEPRAGRYFGTDLCSVLREPTQATHGALWMDDRDVEVVASVPGRPNTALAFVNGAGAHRASIPSDAPADTERYLYQLQLGPSPPVQRRLLAGMRPEDAMRWTRRPA
jgi:hypothetical protein